MTRHFATFLTLLLMAVAGNAQMVRTWVSTSGLDTNPCSKAQPCRNFSAAVAAVAPGGEVVVADSGGYGVVVITKSVALIAPNGIHAAIAPTSGTAIVVNLTSDERVLLRNLFLNNLGTSFSGVQFNNRGSLFVEDCEIAGFGTYAVFGFTQGSAQLYVRNSVLRDSGYGIAAGTGVSGFVNVTVDRCRFERNTYGAYSEAFCRMTIRDSVIVHSASNGAKALATNAQQPAELNIENCLFSFNNIGIDIQGVVTTNAATVRVSNTMVTNNTVGLQNTPSGTMLSFGNNRINGNGTNGSFDFIVPMQ